MPDSNLPSEALAASPEVLLPPSSPPVPTEPAAPGKLHALAEMAICSSVPTQLAIGSALRLAGWSPTGADGELRLGFVTALTLLDTMALIALMVAFMRSRGERPSVLWLGSRPPLREVMTGLAHVPIVFLIGATLLLTIRALAPGLHNVDVNPFEALAGNSLQDAAMLGLVAIVAGGVREELQRAFLLDRFERHFGPAWAGVVVLSTAFGLGHLLQGRDAAIATAAMGAFWAVVYLRRRSSVAPMVSHALFNSLEVLVLVTTHR